MNAQLFLNNFDTQFIASVKAAPTTGTPATELDYGIVRVSQAAGAILGTLTNGDYYILTAFKRSGSNESSIEVMKVTTVDTSVINETRLTVLRGQEGTTPESYVSGDYLSLRFTASSATGMLQKSGNLAGLADADASRANLGAAPTASPSFTGNVSLTSSGARILGDFSNAAVENRVAFQSSVVNGNTELVAVPNGTAKVSGAVFHNGTDPANAQRVSMSVSDASVVFASTYSGAPGAALPIVWSMAGVERMRLLPTGEIGIGATPTAGHGTLQVPDINGGATSGFKNKIVNGCMRVSMRGSGAAALGANRLGADGVITYIGGWSGISGWTINRDTQVVNDSRTSSGALHSTSLGTVTGASGFMIYLTRIEAADAQELGGKVVTISAKLHALATAPSNHFLRIYEANALNDFSAHTLVTQSSSMGALSVGVTATPSHTFTIPATSCTNGLQVEIVVEYSGAIAANSFLFIGDWQFSASSKPEPFELRPIAIEEQLCSRYYRKQDVWIGTSTARTCFPINMVKTPTLSGGGAGFTSTGTDKDTFVAYQTTAALQTIVFDSEL
jgi:hypothetical protein